MPNPRLPQDCQRYPLARSLTRRQLLLAAATYPVAIAQQRPTESSGLKLHQLEQIRVRDPYVLPDQATQTYYLYVQMGNRLGNESQEKGVEAYISKDLKF